MTALVRDEVVEVCDGRLSVRFKVAGEGPPLVFFHPLPGLEWQSLLDRLAGSFTVYAPEHPGTTPGDPQAIREVHTFWELLLMYEEALRVLGARASGDRRHVVRRDGRRRPSRRASPRYLRGDWCCCRRSACGATTHRSSSWRWSRGPPEALPGLLYKHPESEEEALALQALPSDPDEVPRAIAQSVWNVGCTTKFAWPIADHGLERRLHRIAAPTLLLCEAGDDALVPASLRDRVRPTDASPAAGSRRSRRLRARDAGRSA